MSSEGLKDKTRNGFVWSTIERLFTQGIQFLFGILIARILSPDDYGIVAMPMIFLALAQVFIDSGFNNALIRKPDLTDDDLSTAFYFNVLVGVVCYCILFAASPLIASFYKTPILTDLLKVTALATLFNPLCSVQQALLTKNIDFKSQAKVSVASAVVSGAVGLYMAYSGFGVWALVFQQVSAALIRTILLWTVSKWRPYKRWSKSSFRYLWGYGSRIMAVGFLDTVFNNIYPLVIGKFYTARDLGNYTRAQQFVDLPVLNFTGVMQRVSLPVLSAIQNDDERLRNNYLKLLRVTAFIVFPLLLGLAVVATPLISLFLGQKWMECVVLMQILCVAKIWTPINAINLSLLQVKGRSDLFLKVEIIKKCVIVVTMCVTIPFGIIWMTAGTIFTTFVAFIINTFYTRQFVDLGFFTQIREFAPALALSSAMVVIVLLCDSFIDSMLVKLLVDVVVGIVVYVGGAICFKLRSLQDAIDFLKRT